MKFVFTRLLIYHDLDLQKKMLKDESTCEGGSIAEKLESILQGKSIIRY